METLIYGSLNKKIKEAQNITQEKITEAVNTYLDENPPTTGATAEQAAQINKNESDIGALKGDINNLAIKMSDDFNGNVTIFIEKQVGDTQ